MLTKLKYIIASIILLSILSQPTCIGINKIDEKVELIKKYIIENNTSEEESSEENSTINDVEELLYINNSECIKFLSVSFSLALMCNFYIHIVTSSLQIPSPPPKFYL